MIVLNRSTKSRLEQIGRIFLEILNNKVSLPLKAGRSRVVLGTNRVDKQSDHSVIANCLHECDTGAPVFGTERRDPGARSRKEDSRLIE